MGFRVQGLGWCRTFVLNLGCRCEGFGVVAVGLALPAFYDIAKVSAVNYQYYLGNLSEVSMWPRGLEIGIYLQFPKGPCTQIVYTLALKYSLYRYTGPQVYTVWVHGPLGIAFGPS